MFKQSTHKHSCKIKTGVTTLTRTVFEDFCGKVEKMFEVNLGYGGGFCPKIM